MPDDDAVPETANEPDEDGDSRTDDEGPVMDQIKVDLNTVPQMFREDLTPFEQGVEEEDVNRALTEQEMGDVEDSATDPDVVTYMEVPASEFENVAGWPSVGEPVDTLRAVVPAN